MKKLLSAFLIFATLANANNTEIEEVEEVIDQIICIIQMQESLHDEVDTFIDSYKELFGQNIDFNKLKTFLVNKSLPKNLCSQVIEGELNLLRKFLKTPNEEKEKKQITLLHVISAITTLRKQTEVNRQELSELEKATEEAQKVYCQDFFKSFKEAASKRTSLEYNPKKDVTI